MSCDSVCADAEHVNLGNTGEFNNENRNGKKKGIYFSGFIEKTQLQDSLRNK